jgi:DNA-binding GntR family transcriptional regulator
MEQTHSKLAQLRDELRLQAHLFKAEVLDEWHRLEKKWHTLTNEIDRLAEFTDDSDENLDRFARGLMEELQGSYDQLREALKDPLA